MIMVFEYIPTKKIFTADKHLTICNTQALYNFNIDEDFGNGSRTNH